MTIVNILRGQINHQHKKLEMGVAERVATIKSRYGVRTTTSLNEDQLRDYLKYLSKIFEGKV